MGFRHLSMEGAWHEARAEMGKVEEMGKMGEEFQIQKLARATHHAPIN